MPSATMPYLPLGASGLKVAPLWLGTMMFGDQTDAHEAARMVAAAREAGVNAIDTADAYAGGESERITGRLIAGRPRALGARHQGSPTRSARARTIAACRAATCCAPSTPAWRGSAPTGSTCSTCTARTRPRRSRRRSRRWQHLVERGKVHHFGVSNFRAWRVARIVEMCRAMGIPPPIVCQPPYNAMSRGIETELLPCCAHYGVGVVAYSPLARGVLSGKYRARCGAARRLARGAPRQAHHADRVPRRVACARGERIAEHARAKRPARRSQFALGWVWNNALVHGVIGGPKTLAQWQELPRRVGTPFDADDEALVERAGRRAATHRRRATPIRSIRSRDGCRRPAEDDEQKPRRLEAHADGTARRRGERERRRRRR